MSDKARWEYPAGCLEADETALEGAIREWEEETGATFPKDATCLGTWIAEDGEFQGFVFQVDQESDVGFGPLDGTEVSAVGWWNTEDLDIPTISDYVREELDEVEPLLEQAQKATRGYELSARSGMVSLDIVPGVLPVIPGGIDDHHITIVYLGKDVDDRLFAEVCAVVRAIASTTTGPLTGTLGGLGTFPASNSSDGMVPVFVTPNIPGIESLRAPLERFNASEHKDFHPHATLAYIDDGDPLPTEIDNIPVQFTHISVHLGGELAASFPFRGCEVEKGYLTRQEAIDAAPTKCPCGESLAWDSINGPQHADGSITHDDGESVSDKVFKANPAQRRGRDGKWRAVPKWEDFHQHTDEIVEYYTPLIEQAMSEVIPTDAIQRALNAVYGGFAKAAPPQNSQTPPQNPPPSNITPNTAAAVTAAAAPFGAAVAGLGAGVAGVGAAMVGGGVGVVSTAAAVVATLASAPLVIAALRSVIRRLYGDAILQGIYEAAQASNGKLPLGVGGGVDLPETYWSTWEPGQGDVAAAAAQTDLPNLTGQLDTWVTEMTRTQVARVGNAIRRGVETGQSIDEVRAAIEDILHDAVRAKLIAETEYARAYAEALLATYRTNDVEELVWLAMPSACHLCLENETASPQPADMPNWPNGPLPVHPHERCSIAPA